MPKYDFCKIIRTTGGKQVLFIKEIDDESENPIIKVIARIPNKLNLEISGAIRMSFEKEEDRDKGFEKLTEKHANDFQKSIEEQMEMMLAGAEEDEE